MVLRNSGRVGSRRFSEEASVSDKDTEASFNFSVVRKKHGCGKKETYSVSVESCSSFSFSIRAFRM